MGVSGGKKPFTDPNRVSYSELPIQPLNTDDYDGIPSGGESEEGEDESDQGSDVFGMDSEIGKKYGNAKERKGAKIKI